MPARRSNSKARPSRPAVRVAGTIPGAVNVPAAQVEASDGTRPADAATIDKVLANAGVTPKGQQITFCNTGHLGAGTWFVLHEVARPPECAAL